MMCFQVSRDCCQEKWKRDFTVCIPSFCDDPRVLHTKSPSNLLFTLQLWLLTFLFQPLSLLGGIGMCKYGIGNSGLEACRWKPLWWYHPDFCACITCFLEQGQNSFSILQLLARCGNCAPDTICPSGLSPLSLQRSPITLLALTSPVTPCHTLPARFLPFLLSVPPLQYSREELCWVWLSLHWLQTLLSWAVGRMWGKPASC